ncbi:molybdopterin-dependent oxidoreductase [Sulfurihydrogenibium azorense]|uniref:molybdopterin-dependent oxidoreductase n=1 Tax=Sulfurihydrogenibium azorense TaxID=309806 RepID=UPI00240A8CE8|nr:molybdopterin-dependent oxidoreductase [Sulfurihydrogenibium azorense]MDM7274416.1 molybdopterin-dependent oxidoreductase [Sulfurihydrogenibium azorense]
MSSRREFLKSSLLLAVAGLTMKKSFAEDVPSIDLQDYPKVVKYPGKADLIMYSDRPPLLETPRSYFSKAVTPNEAFFVRWHLSNIPTEVDLKEWRLTITGNVNKTVSLTLDEIKSLFEPVSYYAVLQCSGNGRSFFEKKQTALGIQWKHGAMGNALWTGVRLADVLNYAGVKWDSLEVAFKGLDKAPYPQTPDVERSLPIDKCLYEDLILAYEMNGEPLHILNGFPLRLIVPGWYATHWIKSVTTITVLNQELKNFWMEEAYHIPDNACHCVPIGQKPSKTRIITQMNVKSVIGTPEDNTVVKLGQTVKIAGVAFDQGYGIQDVLISFDGGKSWKPTSLGPDLGRYSFREWYYYFRPTTKGEVKVMVRAINKNGETQPIEAGWNPGGYMWNGIDTIKINVV